MQKSLPAIAKHVPPLFWYGEKRCSRGCSTCLSHTEPSLHIRTDPSCSTAACARRGVHRRRAPPPRDAGAGAYELMPPALCCIGAANDGAKPVKVRWSYAMAEAMPLRGGGATETHSGSNRDTFMGKAQPEGCQGSATPGGTRELEQRRPTAPHGLSRSLCLPVERFECAQPRPAARCRREGRERCGSHEPRSACPCFSPAHQTAAALPRPNPLAAASCTLK